jgi:PAS domain S-box-containing protein
MGEPVRADDADGTAAGAQPRGSREGALTRAGIAIPPEADARFHSLILRQIHEAVVSIDNAGLVTYLNPTAERQYDVTSTDAVGRPLRDIYEYGWRTPQDEADAADQLRRNGFWRGHNTHVLRNGRVLEVESAVTVLRDDVGHETGLLAVIRDVTAALRAEQALRVSEERLRRALSIDTVGVLFFTLDGRITDANPAFERMSGYTCSELRTIDHWHRLTAAEFQEATARAAAEVAERGETAPYEKQMIRKNGSRWWGLFAPKRIAGAGADAECVEFILDITHAKQGEAILQELEERRRMALDAAELGTWKHDLATGRVELDERARAHYGIDSAVVPIEQVARRIHPEDAARLQQAIAQAVDPASKRPVAAEYRVLDADGSIRWLSVNGRVRFDTAAGSERATVGIGTTRDITERKQVEAALRDADRRKDEFLAILAHELRNPLAPIRTATGILRAHKVPEALQLRAREVIERQVAHMARLVDDLLDVSRLSRGQLSLQRAHVDLNEVLDHALETARPLIEDRRHRLVERRSPRPMILDADLARLSQVFANLLNNAAKYTPAGGTITVAVADSGGHVDVRVSDTGEGIAPEHLGAVFELFTQGSGATTSSAGGLGIGLALARRLVELHGGVLNAASPGIGRGATFTVTLPLAASAEVPRQLDPPAEAVTHICRRVLVVDDNTDAADTTAVLLQASGAEVRTAYDGEQALRDVADFHPDIVVLDLGMPGVSGVEVCRRIRLLPDGQSVVVVAVTGWGQEDSRRRTLAAGFDAHLVKPVAPDALLRLVRDSRPRSADAAQQTD